MRHRILRHGIVDSTNERAFAALAAGKAQHGDVHVAEGQSAGRGRRGRSWESPAGTSLSASLVLLPGADAPLRPAAITMAAGVAVFDTVQDRGLAPPPRLKWPNDMLLGDAKLCGILAELRTGPAGSSVVLGIGVNVCQREFPPELLAERPVTSLLLAGWDTSPDALLDALLPHLDRRLAQAAGDETPVLTRDYLAATGLAGREVRAQVGSDEHRGLLMGLDLDRGLRLRPKDATGGADEELHLPLEHVTALAAQSSPDASR